MYVIVAFSFLLGPVNSVTIFSHSKAGAFCLFNLSELLVTYQDQLSFQTEVWQLPVGCPWNHPGHLTIWSSVPALRSTTELTAFLYGLQYAWSTFSHL